MSLVYRRGVEGLLGGLDPTLADTVSGSVQATIAYAQRIDDAALSLSAKQAYVHAMHIGAVASAAFALLAALVALKWIPGREPLSSAPGTKPAEEAAP
jgi:hypothetical protein